MDGRRPRAPHEPQGSFYRRLDFEPVRVAKGGRRVKSSVGGLVIIAGIVLVLIGVLASTGLLSWFGRLPGDIRIERANTRIYFPITSMILVSIILSLILALIRRFR